ncbi:MAG: hypothetical protein ACI9CF_001641 [Candidatus Omnitrophota bacterium]|jgi:hypothetical protein
MKESDLITFFTELDKLLQIRCDIILTGASAGMLMGHIRPSLDIDFEIRPLDRQDKQQLGNQLPHVISEVTKVIPVAADYSGDISHWGQINYLDYRDTALPYKVIGLLQVRIMAPEYWTIGKMTRYIAQDIEDIKIIIKSKHIQPEPLINLWAKALNSSELSLTCSSFKRHVSDFITTNATTLWNQPPQPIIQNFTQQIVT